MRKFFDRRSYSSILYLLNIHIARQQIQRLTLFHLSYLSDISRCFLKLPHWVISTCSVKYKFVSLSYNNNTKEFEKVFRDLGFKVVYKTKPGNKKRASGGNHQCLFDWFKSRGKD